MHYRKIWEKHYKQKIPDGHEIHHIDGNHTNNDITNLQLVTIQEPLNIHESQEDWGAVQAILLRCSNDKTLISEAASKAQKEKFKNGTHNFQKPEIQEKRKQAQLKELKERIEKTGVAFLNIQDPIENARNAGLAAKAQNAGFLNTKSENHGSKHVKDTQWWINSDGKRKRSKHCPGNGWQKGMKYND